MPFGPVGNLVTEAGSACLTCGAVGGNGPLPVFVTRTGPIRSTPWDGLGGMVKDTCTPASRSG